ncbi:hypothetical protein [Microbacterium dextranolyticum]|uniref:Uncharacterized protein n=1 Tax=Microbacterium dextranolyticum TaxID=36806 RepID=A0A9W6M609_9MICO|nr:hypothetical protein [Microbacterium dextranolyticum]MBM7462926.1 hypothetical protein [Microbacterium dextranolyticum]GLJ95969.1 hypothetical protein GCM10017591_20320 [Microbacterium dextranolyticum]
MTEQSTSITGRRVRVFPASSGGWAPISGVVLAEDDITILVEDTERQRQSVIPFTAIGRIELGSHVKGAAA